MGVQVDFVDDLALITLGSGENKFTFEFMKDLNDALDQVLEKGSSVRAVITTGQGKFYSNGIDLEALADYVRQGRHNDFFVKMHRLVARFLTLPIPSIAALNGHAFAGGAILAMSHDYCVMRTGKGWLCYNEIHMKMTFGPQFMAFLRIKLPPGSVFTKAVIYGHRYTAEEAFKEGLVQKYCQQNELLETAKKYATRVLGNGIDRETLGKMKEDIYKPATDLLTHPGYKQSKL